MKPCLVHLASAGGLKGNYSLDPYLLSNLKFLHARCRERSGTRIPSIGAEGEMATTSASAEAVHLKGYVSVAQCSAHCVYPIAIPEAVQSGTGTPRHSYTSMHICAHLG